MSFNHCGPRLDDEADHRIKWIGCCDGLGRFIGFRAHVSFGGPRGFKSQAEAAEAIDASKKRLAADLQDGSARWLAGVEHAAKMGYKPQDGTRIRLGRRG